MFSAPSVVSECVKQKNLNFLPELPNMYDGCPLRDSVFYATETHVGDSTAVYFSFYSYTFHPGGGKLLRLITLSGPCYSVPDKLHRGSQSAERKSADKNCGYSAKYAFDHLCPLLTRRVRLRAGRHLLLRNAIFFFVLSNIFIISGCAPRDDFQN